MEQTMETYIWQNHASTIHHGRSHTRDRETCEMTAKAEVPNTFCSYKLPAKIIHKYYVFPFIYGEGGVGVPRCTILDKVPLPLLLS